MILWKAFLQCPAVSEDQTLTSARSENDTAKTTKPSNTFFIHLSLLLSSYNPTSYAFLKTPFTHPAAFLLLLILLSTYRAPFLSTPPSLLTFPLRSDLALTSSDISAMALGLGNVAILQALDWSGKKKSKMLWFAKLKCENKKQKTMRSRKKKDRL